MGEYILLILFLIFLLPLVYRVITPRFRKKTDVEKEYWDNGKIKRETIKHNKEYWDHEKKDYVTNLLEPEIVREFLENGKIKRETIKYNHENQERYEWETEIVREFWENGKIKRKTNHYLNRKGVETKMIYDYLETGVGEEEIERDFPRFHICARGSEDSYSVFEHGKIKETITYHETGGIKTLTYFKNKGFNETIKYNKSGEKVK